MEKEILTAVALGIGLSASAGFRVFVPLLVAGLAARLGFLPLNESFEWLSSNVALASFGVATLLEITAYYIPFIDNLLDSVAIPLAIGAGTLLTASVLPVDSEFLRWVMGFIIGGSASAIVQGGTTALRLTSTGTTGGVANPVVSTGENGAAIGVSVFTIILPVVVAVFIVLIMFFILRKVIKRMRRLKQNKTT